MVSLTTLCPFHRLSSMRMLRNSGSAFLRNSVAVVTVLSLLSLCAAEDLKFKSVKDLKSSLDTKQKESEPLSLMWGIADATAVVGKLFVYPIPADAFQGNVVHYHVTEVGKDTLPSWLVFDSLKSELKGIPGAEDLGQVYLEVTAIGDDNSKADDVFSIQVRDDQAVSAGSPVKSTGSNIAKNVRCRREEPQTSVTIIVDADLESLAPADKISLLDNVVSHLNLAPEMLKLMPVGNKPMFDNTALVAGPGDRKVPQFSGVLLSWLVGCGKVESDHMPVLELLERSAEKGDMGDALGHHIIGWHVTNTRFQENSQRKRRAIRATATPTMTMPAPTSVVEASTGTDAMTHPAMATSTVSIMPTQTIDTMPSQVMTTPTVAATSVVIAPTESVKMPKTAEPTGTPQPTTSSAMPSPTTASTTMAPTTQPPTTTKPTTTKPTTKQMPQPDPMPDSKKCPPVDSKLKKPPMLKMSFKNFTFMAGDIQKYKVPENTFFDCYAGSTSNLDVDILLEDGTPLPKTHWLLLSKRQNKQYQILANPLNIHADHYTFLLKATSPDTGKSVLQKFGITVEGEDMSKEAPNHEISMTIDANYNNFMADMESRIQLGGKIASVYGDRNTKMMTVTRIAKGSVIYAWTNNSLSGDSCPTGDIGNMANKLINDDGSLNQEAVEKMKPFKLSGAAVAPLGACAGAPGFPEKDTKSYVPPATVPTPDPTYKVVPGDKTTSGAADDKTTMGKGETTTTAAVAAAGAGGGGSDIWITTVVPAIVVVVVLVIALIIACVLYRKKRKGKMELEEKNAYGNKGVPVIFADEYDEKPNDSTKPLIMEEEKPPMPPPEYQRAASEGSASSQSTQPVDGKPSEEIEMEDTETSPLYQPPPPVTASSQNKPPPPHLQASRNPPPYVPP